jgi:hypothetical protein
MSRRPSDAYDDWLRLLEPEGPFFTAAVLRQAFPSGLDRLHSSIKVEIKERWVKAADETGQRTDWVLWLLRAVLGWGDRLLIDTDIPSGLSHDAAEHETVIRPDAVLVAKHPGTDNAVPRVLVQILPVGTRPDRRVPGDAWTATPIQRAALLCRSVGCPLAIVTDGNLITIVRAPRDEATGFGTWRANLFTSEPETLNALVSLFNLRRFQSLGPEDTPEKLLSRSATNQSEITNTLGRQAREAVELLVNAISRGNLDQRGRLLDDVTPHDVYEAAVTVLMRIVILLTSEERGLLPADDPFYASTYALSTLHSQLEDEASVMQEQLELRHTAWHRLLATSRAVHSGVRHHQLHVPAYGSRLFDPDRFPFLEGRREGETTGEPLRVDDLSMLGILRSLLELRLPGELRRLSYKHLEVEQVGHVYESLLDHNAIQADEIVLGLIGKAGDEPEIPLEELEAAALDGDDVLISLLRDTTGRTEKALAKLLADEVDDQRRRGLLEATNNDVELVQRLLPYANLLRLDLRNVPLVFLPGAVYVTETTRKRDSGTAYTTRELADEVAQYALEPLVYSPGPLEDLDPKTWRLKSSEEILNLNICDPAIGSGAIAVAACRYLAERLVEAWRNEGVIDGSVASGVTSDDPEHLDVLVDARRQVAERCIYGVDRDPMAVEMAKLSLWLVTLAKDRPFTFLDHAIVAGDSLLGLTDVKQLTSFHIDPLRGKALHSRLDATALSIENALIDVTERRQRLELQSVRTIVDVRLKTEELAVVDAKISDLQIVADLVIGAALAVGSGDALDTKLKATFAEATKLLDDPTEALREKLKKRAQQWLDTDLPDGQTHRRPLHWVLAFPEAMTRGGFDGFVGNPPYIGNKYWKERVGADLQSHYEFLTGGKLGKPDLIVLFAFRMRSLLASGGCVGFLSTQSISEVDSKKLMLRCVLEDMTIYRAISSRPWPGVQAIFVSELWMAKSPVKGQRVLNKEPVSAIGADLRAGTQVEPELLGEFGAVFEGVHNSKGLAFVVAADSDLANRSPLFKPYVSGEDLTQNDPRAPIKRVLDLTGYSEADLKSLSATERDFIEQVVRPARSAEVLKPYKGLINRWWTFWNTREAGYAISRRLGSCIVMPSVSKHHVALELPSDWVFTNKVVVYERFREDLQACLLACTFDCWSLKFGGSMGGGRVMKIADVVGTYPLPREAAGTVLGAFWQQLVFDVLDAGAASSIGDVLNQVNDGDSKSRFVEQVRSAQIEIDQWAAARYGWGDIRLDHGFHSTPQGERFTISPAAQSEVLDRLLELNHQRHAEELASRAGGNLTKPGRKGKASRESGLTLFGED